MALRGGRPGRTVPGPSSPGRRSHDFRGGGGAGPKREGGGHGDRATRGVMVGFTVTMILDVAFD
jgi:hypothetical protein